MEAAFITPVLFYFLLGIMEYGLAFRSYLTLGNGLRAGARTASIYGNDAEADYRTIQAVKNETFAIKSGDIVKLIIFKANAVGTPAFTRTVPAACLAASVSSYVAASNCNIYGPTRDWNPSSVAPGGPELHYGCSGSGTDWAAGWCPTTRFAAATNGGTPVAGPPDYVGVYLEINHKYVSGLFGTTRKISDVNVAQIEPKSQI